MRLDGLATEEENIRDLRVGPSVDHEPRNLQLTPGQGRHAESIPLTGPRAPVGAMAELAQLPLGSGAIPERAARVEVSGGAAQLRHATLGLAGSCERAPGERPRERGLDRSGDLLRGSR